MPSCFAAELAAFQTEGHTVFRGVIDAALLAEISAHVEWLQTHRADRAAVPELYQLHLMNDDPFWVRTASDSRLLDIGERFVGPDIALFNAAYFCKAPSNGSAVLWHQDGAYWPLESERAVTLWLAVDDSTPENGCMRVIPRSHHMSLSPRVPRPDTPNMLGSGIDENLVDESKAVDVVLRAGDVSVHHSRIIHGSRPNTSPRRRCGMALRYIPATARITVRPGEAFAGAFFMRGHDPGDVNDYNRRPRYVPGKHMPFAGCEYWE